MLLIGFGHGHAYSFKEQAQSLDKPPKIQKKLGNVPDRNNEDNIQESIDGDDDEDIVKGDQPLKATKQQTAPCTTGSWKR
jgi:hypothetical protein